MCNLFIFKSKMILFNIACFLLITACSIIATDLLLTVLLKTKLWKAILTQIDGDLLWVLQLAIGCIVLGIVFLILFLCSKLLGVL